MIERNDENERFYGRKIKPAELIKGAVRRLCSTVGLKIPRRCYMSSPSQALLGSLRTTRPLEKIRLPVLRIPSLVPRQETPCQCTLMNTYSVPALVFTPIGQIHEYGVNAPETFSKSYLILYPTTEIF